MKIDTIYVQGLNMEITFLIGKSAEDNFAIIDESDASDIWFHSANSSSCHIIAIVNDLGLDKKQIKYIIKQGALLCKKYTNKLANQRNVEITYTEVKNVTKTNILGTVTTSLTKSIII